MELIVNNKEDFELLKKYASYSSDLTGVIEIENSSINYVLENYKDLVEKYSEDNIENLNTNDTRPELFYQNGKLFIDNIDDTLSLYLDLPFNKEVKQGSFDKVIEMLDNNMIKLADSAKYQFSKITEDNKVSDLYCSRYNINYKHKRWNLLSLGNDATIKDLKFSDRDIDVKSYKVYKCIKIERVEGTTVFGKNDFGTEFELRFYYLSFAQQTSFTPGAVINVMTDKPYGRKDKKIIINPEIVPNAFTNTFIRKTIKTNKRDIPIKLLRSAFMEYSYRNKL